MKHLLALLIKAMLIEAISLVALVTAGATLSQALSIGLVTTVVLYLMGDMMVLPIAGNAAATIGDASLAAITAWLGRFYAGVAIGLSTAIAYALLIGLAEFFFHRYIQKVVFPGGPVDL